MKTTRDKAIRRLKGMQACSHAMAWIKDTPGTPQKVWDACDAPYWMMWLISRCSGRQACKNVALYAADITLKAAQRCHRKHHTSLSKSDLTQIKCFVNYIKDWADGKMTANAVTTKYFDDIKVVMNDNNEIASALLDDFRSLSEHCLTCRVGDQIIQLGIEHSAYDDRVIKRREQQHAKVLRKHFPKCPI